MRTGLMLCLACTVTAIGQGRSQEKVSPEPAPRFQSSFSNGSTAVLESTARDTLIKVTNPNYSGSGQLTFADGTAPTRFVVRLTQVTTLQRVSLSNGKINLIGQQMGEGTATAYFDEKGRVVDHSTRAAYTMKLERHKNGDIDVHVQCPPGTSLGRDVNLEWTRVNQFGRRGLILE